AQDESTRLVHRRLQEARGLVLGLRVTNRGRAHPSAALNRREDHIAPLRRWPTVADSLRAELGAVGLVKLASDVRGVGLDFAAELSRVVLLHQFLADQVEHPKRGLVVDPDLPLKLLSGDPT